jgi:hypothetical protein
MNLRNVRLSFFFLLQAKYPLALCGDLRFADRKNRSFKTYLFEFSQAKLCYYKDKSVSMSKNINNCEIIRLFAKLRVLMVTVP